MILFRDLEEGSLNNFIFLCPTILSSLQQWPWDFHPQTGSYPGSMMYSGFLLGEDFKGLWVSPASPTWPFALLLENGLLP